MSQYLLINQLPHLKLYPELPTIWVVSKICISLKKILLKEGQEDTKVEMNLAAGETHTFEEKSESMGSWTAFRKIKHLRFSK